MTPDLANLRRLVDLVYALRDGLPKVDQAVFGSYDAHRSAGNAALDRLVAEEGARVLVRGSDITLTMAGIRSSCTWGHAGLMFNWATAAQKKIRALQEGEQA